VSRIIVITSDEPRKIDKAIGARFSPASAILPGTRGKLRAGLNRMFSVLVQSLTYEHFFGQRLSHRRQLRGVNYFRRQI
jgi:hypothetical protein